jgi:nanoRNase/pAp phosphatase (c-di-AMP/oligoRNAs hydrolase)
MNSNQQINDLIKNNNSFAIILKNDWSIDELAAAGAWLNYLTGENKNANIYCANKLLDEQFDYLNIRRAYKNNLSGNRYQINVDISQSGIKELSYNTVNNTLKIFVTPQRGQLQATDVKLETLQTNIDVIFCLGMSERGDADKLFADNPEVFYKLPIINIDCDPENNRFGSINIIDITASSICEISYKIINGLNPLIIKDDLATCLLTGIIAATQSFLHGRTSPLTLEIASQLVANGGKRDKIVANLYQTKTVKQLRLWGNILKELKEEAGGKLLLTEITIEKSVAEEKLIGDLANELLINNPQAKIALIIIKSTGQEHKVVFSQKKSYDFVSALQLNSFVIQPTIIVLENSEKTQELITKIINYLEQF